MKLLFFVEHFSMAGSGAENDAVQLCRALAARGHEVHVCCDDGEEYESIHIHTPLAGADEVITRVNPDKTIDWGFFHEADIYRLGGGIHQSYLDYYLQSFPTWWRPVKRLEFNVSRKHQRQIAYENRFLKTPGSQYLAISQLVAEQAQACGVPQECLQVVYNGVDAARFAEPDPDVRQRIRKGWGANDNEVVFLFIAHNLRLKNLALLIKVFDQLSQERDDLKLVVCGKRAPSVRRPYLVHAGMTQAIEEFYWASDALLHPTYFDSFANVVLEAMAAGLPVAVSDCAGVSELVTDKQTGLVGPVQNRSEAVTWWTSTIRNLAADPDYRKKLGQAGKAACQSHSRDVLIDAFGNCLRD